jgi:5-enolpyruvylshikimate-3-phosphate synthase
MIVANLSLGRPAEIDNPGCISKSFPEFLSIINNLRKYQ